MPRRGRDGRIDWLPTAGRWTGGQDGSVAGPDPGPAGRRLVDADNFKSINTSSCCRAGTTSPSGLRTLVNAVRTIDTVGRVGEEFMVVAPETNTTGP